LTIALSGRTGAGDRAGARSAMRAGWLLFGLITPVVAIGGFLLRRPLAQVFLDDADAVGSAAAYLGISLPAVALFYGQWMINGLFSGHGDTRTPMRLALLANAIVLVGDPVLIYGLAGFPRLGVAGAAIATAAGRFVSVGVGLLLARRLSPKQDQAEARMPAERPVRAILAAGAPMAGDFLVRMAGALGTVAIVGGFGVVAVAAYGIGMKALYVATMAFYAIRNAATIHAPKVLASTAPQDADSARSVISRATLRLALVTGLLAALVFAAGAGWIMRAFTAEPQVIAAGGTFLRCVGPYLIGLAGVVALGGFLMGSGRGPVLFAVTVGGMAAQLGLAWPLSAAFGLVGVWAAMGVAAAGQLAAILAWGLRPQRRPVPGPVAGVAATRT
jgi:Na+-driven multidrug efflux pump